MVKLGCKASFKYFWQIEQNAYKALVSLADWLPFSYTGIISAILLQGNWDGSIPLLHFERSP